MLLPCKKELPLLAKKEAQYPNVQFIAVHAETNPETGSNLLGSGFQQHYSLWKLLQNQGSKVDNIFG